MAEFIAFLVGFIVGGIFGVIIMAIIVGAIQGRKRGHGMIHKFNLWHDFILPILYKVVGKKYGCCNKVKNCHKCCVKNGYEEW